jgi:hypothetical protein
MIFEGRPPVSPEVQMLHDHYGKPEKGQVFTHDEIGDVIKEKYGAARYRTITTTWRKQIFRMYGIIVDAIPGQGFKALLDSEGLQYSDKQLKSSGRKMKKAAQSAMSIDEKNLTQDEKSVLQHRIVTHAKLRTLLAAEQRRKLTT